MMNKCLGEIKTNAELLRDKYYREKDDGFLDMEDFRKIVEEFYSWDMSDIHNLKNNESKKTDE